MLRLLPILAVILSIVAILAMTSSYLPRYPAYHVEAGAGWEVEISIADRYVSLVAVDGSYAVLLDGDGPEDDGMFAGVYLTIGGRTFSGYYLGHEAPLLAPERPYVTQSQITVEASGNRLLVTILDDKPALAGGNDPYPLVPPFRMEAEILLGQETIVHLRGLYYILPTGLERVLLWSGPVGPMVYEISEEGPWRAYVEDITAMEFVDSMGTWYKLETNARVIQFEALRPGPDPTRQVYEIDFDHSYKEYGQFDIITTLVLRP